MRLWSGVVMVGMVLTLSGMARGQKLTVVAGGGEKAGNAPALQAKLNKPFAVGFDKAGNMFVAEFEGHRICRVDKRGELTVYSGIGEKGNGGEGGPAIKAQFNEPHHLLVAPNGDVYVADTFNSRVCKIDSKTHRLTTVFGTGVKGFSGDDGPANQAKCGNIYCLAADKAWENLYLDDLDNRRIRKVSLKTGIITTVAGNGQRGAPLDGADAADSPLMDPRAIALDSAGSLYILERGAPALRVVDKAGKIRTVAGTGKAGPSEDSVEAKRATLRGPKHLCVDHEDNVIIADSDNHVIRKYIPRTGLLIRIAGTGKSGIAGTGDDPKQTELNQPHGVFVDSAGTLYISDSWNDRIVKISP